MYKPRMGDELLHGHHGQQQCLMTKAVWEGGRYGLPFFMLPGCPTVQFTASYISVACIIRVRVRNNPTTTCLASWVVPTIDSCCSATCEKNFAEARLTIN